ncbi:hypothetical protein AB9T89_18680 [Flavobacterium oncorhynchi]|uniref:hypothetical protein n=1 Tax=Flavobacterium oncorhynchi TaxID=728056 RepID=UPI00351A938D
MYLEFLDFDENKPFISVLIFYNYNSSIKTKEDFKLEIEKNTVLFLPNEEKYFVSNLYEQDESDYLIIYKVLPSRYYKVLLKICGSQIKQKMTSCKKQELKKNVSKYDFNDYQSNEFLLKIKE